MNGRLFERWVWGLIIVGIGVVFLLRQLNVPEFDFDINIGYLFKTYWPLFLIIPGLRGLLFQDRYNQGQSFGNLVLVGIGAIFLSENLGWFDFSWGDLFRFIFPIGIILFGLSFLFKNKKHDNYNKNDHKYDDTKYNDSKYNDNNYNSYNYDSQHDDFDHNSDDDNSKPKNKGFKFEATFGSSSEDKYRPQGDPYHYVNTDSPKKTINRSSFISDVYMGQDGYWELQPLNISHFIGDTVIDLTKASIPYGETKINVSSFIGDVKIFVPHDVDVEVSVTASSFIGDQRVFDRRSDGMFGNTKVQSNYYMDAPRKIRINVSMFIGDVIVKKVG